MKSSLSSLGLSQTSYHNTPTRCFLFLNNFLCLRPHKQRKVPLRAEIPPNGKQPLCNYASWKQSDFVD